MKEVILYGTGMIGEKFYWKYKMEMSFAFCIDRKHRTTFHGLTVYSLEDVNAEDIAGRLIIVAVQAYSDIKSELTQKGYREFKDYTWYYDYGRKLAIAYGNCHISVLREYLHRTPEFDREYSLRCYSVFGPDVSKEMISIEEREYCRLFITQDIREENSAGVTSANELISQMNPDCISVLIPNLYGVNLFFPQMKDWEDVREMIQAHVDAIGNNDKKREYYLRWESSFTACIDIFIEQSMRSCGGVAEAVNAMCDEDLLDHDTIRRNFHMEINSIKEREEKCDITISDFILSNYKTNQLFYDPTHPTEKLIAEMGRRILEMIGVECCKEIEIQPILNDTEVFIYECVRKALDISFTQEYIRVGRDHSGLLHGTLTREDYVNDVMAWSSI